MPNLTADRLQRNIDRILTIWEERVNKEVAAAHHQGKLALRNSLPQYLKQLVDALSNTIDRTAARRRSDKKNSSRTGKKHGEDRAGSRNYTMDQLITEYHILRQVVCDVLEEKEPLTSVEREVIVCSIEQAVNDAATEYSEILRSVKESVSNTLAHDLRNPITSTKITAQMMLRKLPPADATAPKMKVILNNMNRLDQMIVELLDANRLEAGQSMKIEAKPCDIDEIVKQTVSDLDLPYPGCFKYQSEGKCEGFWDESGVRRILENLLSNAIKYGEENTAITVSISQDINSAELSVHNLGKAIPAADVPILFEQYRRLESSRKNAGWGLGLTMVKGMVDAHKGSIVVESDDTKGTTFKIKLPKDARSELDDVHPHEEEKPSHVEQVLQVEKSDRSNEIHH